MGAPLPIHAATKACAEVVMEAVIKLHNIQHKGVADLVTEDNPLLSLSFSSTPLADAALLLIGGLIFLLPIGGCDQAITKGPPNRKWFVVFRLVLAFVRFVLNMVFLRRLSPRTCRYRKLKTRKLQRNTIDCTVPAYGVVKQTKRSMRGVRSVGVKSFVTDETVLTILLWEFLAEWFLILCWIILEFLELFTGEGCTHRTH
ncbi:uncharacterized protein [Aegilops tauschii subsp. strangulata]|uniref:uncharacterized protein isoform X2 n=1 Tax=Aegilops tauschii subsp. strangulata TaxID=200361 RepID=UPI001ABCD562|nr:uncharacterized protein LOC109740908 isoform X2 [Aegilops tauschii subsp. strangulata]XP_044357993.1 uncharacterized protein LOC123079314 isoform X2 [Triticum aestivum]